MKEIKDFSHKQRLKPKIENKTKILRKTLKRKAKILKKIENKKKLKRKTKIAEHKQK